MSEEQVREVVGAYFSSLRTMDVDRLHELFDDDALSWDPVGSPPMRVRDKSTNYFRALSNIFEKMALTEVRHFCLWERGRGPLDGCRDASIETDRSDL